jgi:putative transposase
MAIKKEVLDQLLDGRDAKAIFGKDGLFDDLKKHLAERILNAEMDDHLDGEAEEGKARDYRDFCVRGRFQFILG